MQGERVSQRQPPVLHLLSKSKTLPKGGRAEAIGTPPNRVATSHPASHPPTKPQRRIVKLKDETDRK
jgi:hypothetical protein